MKRTSTRLWLLALCIGGLVATGCDDKPSVALAPTASALAPTKAPAGEAKRFAVDKPSTKIEFSMEAPQEKIRGRVSGAMEGDLQIDVMDLTKTTGLLTVDISGIELFQTKADESGKFTEETKSDLQNEHARAWLEIGKDAPEDMRKANARVEFAIRSIDAASEKSVQRMTGAERKVTLKATGDFLLHGRKTTKTADLEATFKYDGDKPVSVAVKTVKPFPVGLAEHDVRPREGFGRLAQKTLEVLSPKVAKEALVSLEFKASLAPGGAPAGAANAPAGEKK